MTERAGIATARPPHPPKPRVRIDQCVNSSPLSLLRHGAHLAADLTSRGIANGPARLSGGEATNPWGLLDRDELRHMIENLREAIRVQAMVENT